MATPKETHMMIATFAVFVAILLVIGLAGCGQALPPPQGVAQATGPEQVEVCLDSDFRSEDVAKADHACYSWSRALRGVAELTPRIVDIMRPVSGCDILIIAVDSRMPVIALQPSSDLGYTEGSTIYVVADRRPDMRELVFTHEIGHALGLKHTASGLMAPAHRHGRAQVSDADAVWAAYRLGERSGQGK